MILKLTIKHPGIRMVVTCDSPAIRTPKMTKTKLKVNFKKSYVHVYVIKTEMLKIKRTKEKRTGHPYQGEPLSGLSQQGRE